jgi:hypothetical protein
MTIEKLIVVTGKPGIFKIENQSKNGLIVQSLSDNKKFPILNIHNISGLNDIAIYTYEDEVPLKNVFYNIYKKENGKKTINHKESKKVLEDFLESVLPNYDRERVYPSNIKKIVQWYNLLVDVGFDFETIPEQTKSTEEEE